ncbi:hypothetical protein TrST_g3819 [Triparma strigata]|uniref:Uncharacterized protein n=1 Tax=Triparma strigata TaxID=1606541 RepID=A0A9W7BT27_9STRA|nr:hypothetical protein TrST_g3819 [Triparma strigata]
MMAAPPVQSNRPIRQRIVVPARVVQFGLDEKFESDPYDVDLKSILSPDEYTTAVDDINRSLKPARPKAFDQAAFYGLGTMVFTAPAAYFVYKRKRKRKKLLLEAISRFNAANKNLYMRWNPRPDSVLTIERRTSQHVVSKNAPNFSAPDDLNQKPREPSFQDLRGGGGGAFDMKPMAVGSNNKI